MLVNVCGVMYYLNFRHEARQNDEAWKFYKQLVSTCSILIPEHGKKREDWLEVSRGETVTYFKDRFSRPVGRKVALARAIKASNFSKQQKREVYFGYFSQIRDGAKIANSIAKQN